MADESRNFWTMFEEAKQEVQKWPEWKREIQVGIYSETPDVICPSPDDQNPQSSKK
jgi:hypothetical protein